MARAASRNNNNIYFQAHTGRYDEVRTQLACYAGIRQLLRRRSLVELHPLHRFQAFSGTPPISPSMPCLLFEAACAVNSPTPRRGDLSFERQSHTIAKARLSLIS